MPARMTERRANWAGGYPGCWGDRVLLFIDANKHVLLRPVARRLRSDDIELNEIGHKFWPKNTIPHTHVDGSLPIDGIFATPDS